ncbi:MarR family winged helix-turn-helix transcriptional regulator [Patulibacter minatonensis]|uniref:MarR family winged helix-turn-helix transcriptional regulator n=1 Tax=Patulibacter minatonensis TaxID=298163 RepID=UPI0004B16D0A|nr:MarR family transcriptional regulator [Patulibacter minatonensis]
MADPATAAGPRADDGVPDTAEPPPLGELIGRAARAIHFQSRQLLAPLGLTPAAARALRTLGYPDRPMRMVDLAERMHVVPRTVTTLVDTLEEAGLVERRPDPNDRRSTLVHLTDRGRGRLDDMLEARRTAAGELLSALTPDEQLQMRRLLAKLDLEGSRPPRC